MAEIIGGIGWILALVFGYLAWSWLRESIMLASQVNQANQWKYKFNAENRRASAECRERQAAESELIALKEAIRERAKQPVIPVQHERSIRKGSWADIRKANQAAILREQEISDKKDANTAFEE